MNIIYDVMGGDNAPQEIIKGAIESLNEFNISITLVGKEDVIIEELKKYSYNKDLVEIVNASEVIENDDDPAMSIRKKKDSSIVVSYKLLSENDNSGVISAGSTGALLAGGLFILKRIKGIDRAVLPVSLPSLNGKVTVIDSGANMDCSAELLKQFAVMGSVYVKHILNVDNPRIGLLNVGTEKGKGNEVVKQAYELLENSGLNFVGNIEARDVMFGKVDIIICDGFAGNILLKNTEGVVMFLKEYLTQSIIKADISDEMKVNFSSLLKDISKGLDYSEYGGTPLLGLKKHVVKAHGSSDSFAIKNATKQLIDYINKDTISILNGELGGNDEK